MSVRDPELVLVREEWAPEVVEEDVPAPPLPPLPDGPPPIVLLEAEVAVEVVEVVDFLLEDRLTLVRPLKQRDNSAAARFVKLTSADIPAPVEPVALFQAARITTKKQARVQPDESAVTLPGHKRSKRGEESAPLTGRQSAVRLLLTSRVP